MLVRSYLWASTRQAVTDNCGAGWDTCLNDDEQCLSGEISDRCKTGVPNSRLTPTKSHAVACNQPQLHFCLLKHLSYISTNLPTPRQPPLKKSCKEQIKMNFNIALQQNCDQSATVLWSKRSSARNWRVRQLRLTWNKTTYGTREPT